MGVPSLWYLGLAVVLTAVAAIGCPNNCECFGDVIDCSNKKIRQIPQIPTWAEELNIGENIGLTITNESFMYLPNLRSLSLDGMRLKELPDLGIQNTLKKLSLAKNKIRDVNTKWFEQFPILHDLNLAKNSINSLVPSQWIHPHLKKLDFNGNRIATIPSTSNFHLPALTSLRLSRNHITTDSFRNLTTILASLPNLKTLDLNRNLIQNLSGHSSVKGLMFEHLPNHTLRTLKLRRNQLSQLPAGIFYGLHSLTTLNLDNNTNITEVNKAWLFGLKSLKVLTLSRNKIGAIKEDAWESTQELSLLDLSSNELGCRQTDLSFKGLRNLKELFISHNCLSNLNPEIFGHLPMLKTLDISHNQIQWSIEDSTGTFQTLTNLQHLDLSFNKIETIHNTVFQPLKSLTRLDLSGNNLKTLSQNPFEYLPNLHKLQFNTSSLVCNCHLLWLPAWLRRQSFDSIDAVCGFPANLKGQSVFDLNDRDFSCIDLPQPEIVVSPKNQTVLYGKNMTLECIALTADKKAVFIWNKDRITEAPYKVKTSISVKENTEPIYRIISHLTVSNVTYDNAGEYQCIVRTSFGPSYSLPAKIIVHQYPYFTKTPESVILKEGDAAELNCAADGFPVPEISWKKEEGEFRAAKERRLHYYPGDSASYIKPVLPRDNGIYVCTAKNEAGSISIAANITVTHTPNFSRPLSNQDVASGQSVVLECQGTGRPKPTVTWYKDGQVLMPSENLILVDEGQFLILLKAEEQDAGRYKCTLGNSLGAQNREIILTVKKYNILPTKTELIILIVVACVVITSLFWVCVIYKTRRTAKRNPEDPGPPIQLYGPHIKKPSKLEANRTPLLTRGENPPNQDSSSEHSSGKDSGVGESGGQRSNEDLRRQDPNYRHYRIPFPDPPGTLKSAVPIYGEIDEYKPRLSTFGQASNYNTYASLRRGSASRLCPVPTPTMPNHGMSSLPRQAYRSHSGSLSHPKTRRNKKTGRSVTPPLFIERNTWNVTETSPDSLDTIPVR